MSNPRDLQYGLLRNKEKNVGLRTDTVPLNETDSFLSFPLFDGRHNTTRKRNAHAKYTTIGYNKG